MSYTPDTERPGTPNWPGCLLILVGTLATWVVAVVIVSISAAWVWGR